MRKRFGLPLLLTVAGACCVSGDFVRGFDDPAGKSTRQDRDPQQTRPAEDADQLIPLNKQKTVLLDKQGKRLLLKSKVVLREGVLEMLLCKMQSKEHESILSLDANAYVIHAGLLALGAKPGETVQFLPKFQAPKGQRINIFLQWKDRTGKLQRVPASRWVRYVTRRFFAAELKRLPPDVVIAKETQLRYDKKFHELSWYGPMTRSEREQLLTLSQDKSFRAAIHGFYKQSQPREMDTYWVFAGSRFSVDETINEQVYAAEGGDVICLANFTTAMIDVVAESSENAEANQLFEPWTERVPPIDTEVTVELVPVFKKADKEGR